MTDSFLKNKKLLNEDIIEFSYNSNAFNYEVNDLITSFKNKYKDKEIYLLEKEVIDNFIKENKNNRIIYKYIINDFITIIKYVNDLKKENIDKDISEKSKIYEIFDKLKNNISKEFLLIFKDSIHLTINKIYTCFKYFLKYIFEEVKDEIKNYQIDLEDNEKDLEDKKNKLDEYYQNKPLITKNNLAHAIRLFMTLVLFREKDKEKKIKNNCKNICTYLQAPDLWDMNIYNDEKFNENLNKLKKIKIKINQILWLYNYLVGNKKAKKYDNKKDDNESQTDEDDRITDLSKEDRIDIFDSCISSSVEDDNNNENQMKEA